MLRLRSPLPAAAAAALLALAPGRAPAASTTSPRPALVVLIVVDQMRPDYFDRFGPQFTGGLARLRRTGAFFSHGRQDHAVTQTAPGHATILSGRPPASNGIVTNDDGVGDPAFPVIGVPDGPGASPRAFRGSALYDWMLARDSSATVLSVSRKDRGAILPVGRARGDVYWFAAGGFTTSRYYTDSLPRWVQAFNARGGVGRLAGTRWTLLRPDSAYAERDSLAFEAGGRDATFPHTIPTRLDSLAARLELYPWMDSLTLDLALEGVRRLGLGRRDRPDLLVVSLSATDEVGHEWGPDSREMHDQLLRLDHWLGWFLDSLAVVIPRERTIIALTADHGAQSAPAYVTQVLHQPAGRQWLGDYADQGRARFDRRYRRSFGFRFEYGLLMADAAQLRALGVDVDSLSEAWAAEARRRTGVARVYTPRSLGRAPASDVYAERWRRTIPPGTGWLFAAVPIAGVIWSRTGLANHGTPLEQDVAVPILFAGAGIRPGRYARPVVVEDIAATLAALIGVRPTERITGRPLPEVVSP